VAARAQRFIEAARKPVPEGTYAIGAGLLIAGLSAYAFQILSYRQLSKAEYNALNGLWVMVFVVAPGFFQPLEQEVARALAHRRAQGIGGAPLVKRAAVLGGILAGAVGLASIIGAKPLIDELFHGNGPLLIGLLFAIASYYLAHMTRGTLSGNGRFGPYGVMHGSEGIVRVLMCAALVVIGVTTPGWYGLALALPPFFAVAISLRGQHGLLIPGPSAPYSELSNALGWLLLGSVLAQALSYAAFIGATLLATDAQKDLVGDFIAGLFMARIPILLFQAVQAALLPKLAAHAGAGRHDDFRGGLRKLVMIVLGVGLLGIVGGFTIGSTAGRILFGEKFVLGSRDVGLLAAGSAGFILALTLAQGLIALRAYREAAAAWVIGIATFIVVTALGNDLLLRVELGFAFGSVAAATAMGGFLLLRMRGGVPTDVEPLVAVIEHEPLEI
jgi:O-antigen/teichoic acid export membrane protein